MGTKFIINQVTPNLTPVSISGYDIPFSQSARNLGVFTDETLSMDVHIKHMCRILFCQLRRLSKIRSFLSTDAANKLAVSFILTRLDYCNSLLAGLPDNKLSKLQRIQNHATRIVLRKPRHASATSMCKTLHWLSVKARIQYKIACLCCQCLCHNTMPSYLSDLLRPYLPPRTLCSLDTSLLIVPRFCLETFGRRSFSIFGSTVWNSLPLSLRKTQCFSTFKKKLKPYVCKRFQDTLDVNIQNATLAEYSTEKWNQFKNVVNEPANSVLGPKQQIHQDWLDDNDEQLAQLLHEKNNAFITWHNDHSSHCQERPVQALEKAGTEKAAGDERYLVGQEGRRSADVC